MSALLSAYCSGCSIRLGHGLLERGHYECGSDGRIVYLLWRWDVTRVVDWLRKQVGL